MIASAKPRSRTPATRVLKEYCENTTAHGFQYWVTARSSAEKVLWVAIVLTGFVTGILMVSATVGHWFDFPTKMAIASHSMPATKVPYPSITICNPKGYDASEYLRAVFDNFQYSCGDITNPTGCEQSKTLRSHFPAYDTDSEEVSCSKLIRSWLIRMQTSLDWIAHS